MNLLHLGNYFDDISGPPLEYVREIGRALRCIGDELDRNEQIQK